MLLALVFHTLLALAGLNGLPAYLPWYLPKLNGAAVVYSEVGRRAGWFQGGCGPLLGEISCQLSLCPSVQSTTVHLELTGSHLHLRYYAVRHTIPSRCLQND